MIFGKKCLSGSLITLLLASLSLLNCVHGRRLGGRVELGVQRLPQRHRRHPEASSTKSAQLDDIALITRSLKQISTGGGRPGTDANFTEGETTQPVERPPVISEPSPRPTLIPNIPPPPASGAPTRSPAPPPSSPLLAAPPVPPVPHLGNDSTEALLPSPSPSGAPQPTPETTFPLGQGGGRQVPEDPNLPVRPTPVINNGVSNTTTIPEVAPEDPQLSLPPDVNETSITSPPVSPPRSSSPGNTTREGEPPLPQLPVNTAPEIPANLLRNVTNGTRTTAPPIPSTSPTTTPAAPTPPPEAASPDPPVPLNIVIHVVQEGETLEDIANLYGGSVDLIREDSNLGPEGIRPSLLLRVRSTLERIGNEYTVPAGTNLDNLASNLQLWTEQLLTDNHMKLDQQQLTKAQVMFVRKEPRQQRVQGVTPYNTGIINSPINSTSVASKRSKSPDPLNLVKVVLVPVLTGLAALSTIAYTWWKCTKKGRLFKEHEQARKALNRGGAQGDDFPPVSSIDKAGKPVLALAPDQETPRHEYLATQQGGGYPEDSYPDGYPLAGYPSQGTEGDISRGYTEGTFPDYICAHPEGYGGTAPTHHPGDSNRSWGSCPSSHQQSGRSTLTDSSRP